MIFIAFKNIFFRTMYQGWAHQNGAYGGIVPQPQRLQPRTQQIHEQGTPVPGGRGTTVPAPSFIQAQNGALASVGQPVQGGQGAGDQGRFYSASIRERLPQGLPTTAPGFQMVRPMNIGNDHSSVGGFQEHMLNMRAEDRRLKPDNTKIAYDPKQEEFIEFCAYQHPSNPSLGLVSSTVTPGKVFEFLYYVSRRGKRKTKKKKDQIKFDRVEYEIIKRDIDYCSDDPIGESVMKQYHGAIMRLWQIQIDAGGNNYAKEQIMSDPTKFLIKSVRIRKARVEDKNCVEKNTHSTHAFEVAKKVPEIEEWMWNR